MTRVAGRLTGTAVLAVAFAAALAAPAAGSELPFPSQQRVSDRGAALPFASAPAQPAGLCIIDSGLTLNPDLASVVVDRESLDGGHPGDVDPGLHGTRMAMEAAAVPGSDWGMVGAAPSAVRIVSIRATSTEDALSFTAYKQAMLLCELRAARFNIKVISLSVGFQGTPTAEQLVQLEDAVTEARSTYGLDVVAASGNEGASRISYPAAAPGVLAVGASNAQREPCAFSNTGPQLALLAPGCDIDEANPLTGAAEYDQAGSSFSAANDAAVLAAVRAYRPDLGPEAAEQLMRSTSEIAGGVLDVGALFRAAGLGGVIADGEAHEPTALASAPTMAVLPSASPTAKHRARLVELRVRIRRRGKMLVVRLLNLPRGDRTVATLLGPRHGSHRRLLRRITSARRTISLSAVHAALLLLDYTDPAGHIVSSRASYTLP
jgi:hypothetical protein